MSKKSKVKFDEKGGPAGLGDNLEEIKNLNVFEFLQETAAFKEVTKDLTKEEHKQVLQEAERQAEGYQKVFNHFTEILSTEEGKKQFAQMVKQKFSGR